MDKVLMPICLWNRSSSVTGLSQGSKEPGIHSWAPGIEELKQGPTYVMLPLKTVLVFNCFHLGNENLADAGVACLFSTLQWISAN